MSNIVVTTYDWVPEFPRGYVRDIRIRWALEEAELPYTVASTSFRDRGPEHFEHQPFGQVPWLTDGDISIFESGAILIYVGEKSDKLMPRHVDGRFDVIKWVLAALNGVEMAALPRFIFETADDQEQTPGRRGLDAFLAARLGHMETVLDSRQWLAGDFSVADIAMSDVLRLVDRFDGLADYPACREYVSRSTERPAFAKAHADQVAHFAAAD